MPVATGYQFDGFVSTSRHGKFILAAESRNGVEHYMLYGPTLTSAPQDLNGSAGPNPGPTPWPGVFTAVNDKGHAVAWENGVAGQPWFTYFHSNHNLVPLGVQAGYTVYGVPVMNDRDNTAGTETATVGGSTAYRPFRWSNGTSKTLFPGGSQGVTTDLGSDDYQVGYAGDNTSTFGWIYLVGNPTTITIPGYSFVAPMSINDNDQVAGTAYNAGPTNQTAFVWSNGSASFLTPLNAGEQTTAQTIDDMGRVFGTSNGVPVVWDTAGVAHDLSTELPPSAPGGAYFYDRMDTNGQIYGHCVSAGVTTPFTLTPPTALNDSYTVNSNASLSIPAPGVLANDISQTTATLVSQASNGTVTLNSDGSFTYVPDSGFVGTDTFTYEDGVPGSFSNVATVTLNVLPSLSLVSLATNPVIAGNDSVATATIDGNAGAGGVTINVTASGASLDSSTATILASHSSVQFNVHTASSSTDSTATVSASLNGVTKTAQLTILAPLGSFGISPSSVNGGGTVTGTVGFGGNALADKSVSITYSADTSGPASVTVSAGTSSKGFTIGTTNPASTQTETLTANCGGVTKSATVTIVAVVLTNFTVDNSNPFMSYAVNGTVTVSPAAGGTLQMSAQASDSFISFVTQPSVAAGQTQGTFKMDAGILTSSSTHQTVVTVSYNGVSLTQTITIKPILLSAFTLTSTTLHSGGSTTGTVTLTQAAGDIAIPVQLSCADSRVTIPATVNVLPGHTSATFNVQVATGITTTSHDQMSASLAGGIKILMFTVGP